MNRIFINYAHENAPIAKKIAESLGEAGFHPWIDTETMRLGDSFLQRMNEGLFESDYLVFLVSKAAVTSRWVSFEWMSALASNNTVVIPVQIEKCEIPPLLRYIVYIDFTDNIDIEIKQLVDFFNNEANSATPQQHMMRGIGSIEETSLTLRGISRRKLRLIASACLDEAKLSAFLYDVEIDPNSVAGNSLHERILYVLHMIEREGLREAFTDWLVYECKRCVTHQLPKLLVLDEWSAGPERT